MQIDIYFLFLLHFKSFFRQILKKIDLTLVGLNTKDTPCGSLLSQSGTYIVFFSSKRMV